MAHFRTATICFVVMSVVEGYLLICEFSAGVVSLVSVNRWHCSQILQVQLCVRKSQEESNRSKDAYEKQLDLMRKMRSKV